MPATAITVLRSLESDKVRIVVFFGSEEDLRTGSKALDAMNPPDDATMRRISVETFELVLNRDTP